MKLTREQLLIPTPDMTEHLYRLKERLPGQGEFIYEFSRKLAEHLRKKYPERIHVNVCANIIKRILREYLNDPVVDEASTKKTTAAGLIIEALETVLRNVCNPIFAKLIIERIENDKDLLDQIRRREKYYFH